jgi:hypothetical protein
MQPFNPAYSILLVAGSLLLMKMPLRMCLLLLLCMLLPGLEKIQAQSSADYDIQANIIYRFTKYIDWPDAKKTGDFVIGVVGDSPLTDALKTFTAGKSVGNQKIAVKRLSASGDVFNCNILFISEEESGSVRKIVIRTAGVPVLIVTESDGLALKGACINFAIGADHLKLEINKSNIEQRDLSIASELLQLGKVVK